MEEYIEKLEGKVTASLIVLDRAKHIPKKKADFSDWKDFGVVDFLICHCRREIFKLKV